MSRTYRNSKEDEYDFFYFAKKDYIDRKEAERRQRRHGYIQSEEDANLENFYCGGL